VGVSYHRFDRDADKGWVGCHTVDLIGMLIRGGWGCHTVDLNLALKRGFMLTKKV
jgi:hypothetical protein